MVLVLTHGQNGGCEDPAKPSKWASHLFALSATSASQSGAGALQPRGGASRLLNWRTAWSECSERRPENTRTGAVVSAERKERTEKKGRNGNGKELGRNWEGNGNEGGNNIEPIRETLLCVYNYTQSSKKRVSRKDVNSLKLPFNQTHLANFRGGGGNNGGWPSQQLDSTKTGRPD